MSTYRALMRSKLSNMLGTQQNCANDEGDRLVSFELVRHRDDSRLVNTGMALQHPLGVAQMDVSPRRQTSNLTVIFLARQR